MIGDVLLQFQTEIQELVVLDQTNQSLFAASASGSPTFTKAQVATLTEGIFLKSYTCFEQFTRKVFLKYCCSEATSIGTAVTSYLKPRDEKHAEEIIRSSQQFLDWNSPDKLIERSECYLDNNGFPIKGVIIASKSPLQDYKFIRNHVAHNSSESAAKYSKVLLAHFGTLPLTLPTPGEFLLEFEKPKKGIKKAYKLQSFFNLINNMAEAMAKA